MSGQRKVISVEDSDTDFMALQFALTAAGVNVSIERCSDGRHAYHRLIDQVDVPLSQLASLILLDLNLPGIDGRQLLKAFRARDPSRQVPVIVLSTSSHPRDIDESYEAGADAYLIKPLELDDWRLQVASLADHWLRAAGIAEGATDDDEPTDRGGTESSGQVRRTLGAGPPDYMDQLARTIESEVIPRLLLAHCSDETLPIGRVHLMTGGDNVSELARLVLEHDVELAARYVEAMRDCGATIEQVFHELIAPAASHLGDLWKTGRCSFPEFSLALQRLQQLLLELDPSVEKSTMH